MKLYGETDRVKSRGLVKKEWRGALLLALPFAVLAVAAFVLRIEVLCIVGALLCGGVLILLGDLRIAPQMRYDRFLREIHSGLTRQTAGALVRIGQDDVYQDGVNFHELILNIYEDMAEEGERRFLLDCAKSVPQEWVGRDVAVVSHGNFVLEIRVMGEADGEN